MCALGMRTRLVLDGRQFRCCRFYFASSPLDELKRVVCPGQRRMSGFMRRATRSHRGDASRSAAMSSHQAQITIIPGACAGRPVWNGSNLEDNGLVNGPRRDPHALRHLLQSAGLRATRSRVEVLSSLARRSHVSADELCARVRAALPGTSLQTIYNVLGDLTAAGLLRRIEPPGSSARYERRVGDNHHHLVCRRCGAIEDIDCTVGQAPCLTAATTHGYRIDEADVTFWGVCPACARRDGRRNCISSSEQETK
jgi:Fur family ferric uptake transcriptional regulator